MDSSHKTYIEDQLQALLAAESLEALVQRLEVAARLLGFDHFAYGMRFVAPFTAPRFELVNNYPDAWQREYSENGYLMQDPTVLHGMRSISPVLWEDSLFADSRPLWEGARSFGLNHGWAQSSFSGNGVSGMVTLSRSAEDLSASELRHKTLLLVWFNQLAHIGLQQFLMSKVAPESMIKLTARELEVLRWTADGKTSYEISLILGISERTVNFHLNNVIGKFQTTNKVAATVKAVTLGLI